VTGSVVRHERAIGRLPPTIQAKTTVHGLVSQKTYWFRYRAVVRSGPLDWSEPVSTVPR